MTWSNCFSKICYVEFRIKWIKLHEPKSFIYSSDKLSAAKRELLQKKLAVKMATFRDARRKN